MNYKSIHDRIIDRAKNRTLLEKNCESHHILPKCEGGKEDGEQVLLTQKEHRIIHKLRYKFTGVVGNLFSYRLMKYGREELSVILTEISRLGGKKHHEILKEKDPIAYRERQRNSGFAGGKSARDKKLGFFSLSEEQQKINRQKGTRTLVDKKIGMFSDEYRKKHKILMQKKVQTPEGVFNSMSEASKYYNVCLSTITYRVNSQNFIKWFLIENGEKE